MEKELHALYRRRPGVPSVDAMDIALWTVPLCRDGPALQPWKS